MVAEQRLMFQGTELDDTSQISDYDIKPRSLIVLGDSTSDEHDTVIKSRYTAAREQLCSLFDALDTGSEGCACAQFTCCQLPCFCESRFEITR